MEKKYCLYCGKEMDIDAAFCPRCGNAADYDEESEIENLDPSFAEYPDAQYEYDESEYEDEDYVPEPSHKPTAMERRANQRKSYVSGQSSRTREPLHRSESRKGDSDKSFLRANLKYIIPIAVILLGIIIAVIVLITPGCSSVAGSANGGYTITSSQETYHVGNTDTLKLTITPKPSTMPKIIWSSSDSKIIKVDSEGKITALAEGKCTITAKSDNDFGTIELEVVLEHKWDEGKVTKKGDCETDGEMTYTCVYCGETKTEVVKATGHSYPDEPDKVEKSEDSCVLIYICENCGQEKEDSGEHTFDEGEVTIEPTCQKKGEKVYTCTRCGYEKTEQLPVANHIYEDGKCKWCGQSEIVGVWKATEGDMIHYNLTVYENGTFDYSDYSTDSDTSTSYAGKWTTDGTGYTFTKSGGGLFGTADFENGYLMFYEAYSDGHMTFSKIS